MSKRHIPHYLEALCTKSRRETVNGGSRETFPERLPGWRPREDAIYCAHNTKNTKHQIYLQHRSNPQQAARAVGASNKSHSRALEARYYASSCLERSLQDSLACHSYPVSTELNQAPDSRTAEAVRVQLRLKSNAFTRAWDLALSHPQQTVKLARTPSTTQIRSNLCSSVASTVAG